MARFQGLPTTPVIWPTSAVAEAVPPVQPMELIPLALVMNRSLVVPVPQLWDTKQRQAVKIQSLSAILLQPQVRNRLRSVDALMQQDMDLLLWEKIQKPLVNLL